MDEAQVKALIDEAVGKALGNLESLLQPIADKVTTSLQEYMDTNLSSLEDRLSAFEAGSVTSGDAGEAQGTGKAQEHEVGATDPLEARLQELEARLQESKAAQEAKDKEAMSLRFSNSLNAALDKHGPNCKPIVEELLRTRYGDGVKETKRGFQVGGKLLDEVVSEFFSSDEGKYFLPSDYQDGSGLRQPQKRSSSATDGDLEAGLLLHFSG